MKLHEIRAVVEMEEHEAFADKVIRALKNAGSQATEKEHEMLHADAARKAKEGWSLEDVIRYMKWTEEFNPETEEDVALAGMKRISDKYKLHEVKAEQ